MPEEKEELTIRDLKLREPFAPFRIVMTSGDKYLIERGENLIFMKSQLFYLSPVTEKFVFMRMNQISGVEYAERARPKRRRKTA